MISRCISIGKPEEGCLNEDAVLAKDNILAVSDGAGGGGLYAERWSRYLLDHLPAIPMCTLEDLDNWIESIWEPFYNLCEEDAKKQGGMFLNKFYDEGSFATLAVAWKLSDNIYKYLIYGDSVVFHYNKETDVLEHSFTTLKDFCLPPYLINCKDEIKSEGCRYGEFNTCSGSIIFVCTDALAHYILMMYDVSHDDKREELLAALSAHSKSENYIRTALALRNVDFYNDVLCKLISSSKNSANFRSHIARLSRDSLIALDDYSFCFHIV